MERINLPEQGGLYKCVLFELAPGDCYLRIGLYSIPHIMIAREHGEKLGLVIPPPSKHVPDVLRDTVRGGAWVDISLEKRTMEFFNASGTFSWISESKTKKLVEESGFTYSSRGP